MMKEVKNGSEYCECFEEADFKRNFQGIAMVMWQALEEVDGDWEFAAYSHFFELRGTRAGNKCYSIRYHDANSETRYFDLDWSDSTEFDIKNIRYLK